MTPFELCFPSRRNGCSSFPKGAEERVKAIFRKWELEAVVVGRVTDDGMLRLYEGETLVVPSARQSPSPPTAPRSTTPKRGCPSISKRCGERPLPPDLEGDATPWLIRLLQDPSIARQSSALPEIRRKGGRADHGGPRQGGRRRAEGRRDGESPGGHRRLQQPSLLRRSSHGRGGRGGRGRPQPGLHRRRPWPSPTGSTSAARKSPRSSGSSARR